MPLLYVDPRTLQASPESPKMEDTESFQNPLNSAESRLLEAPKEATPREIFEVLKEIPGLARADLLRAYSLLIRSDRLFRALMALPMDMRMEWLLIEVLPMKLMYFAAQNNTSNMLHNVSVE